VLWITFEGIWVITEKVVFFLNAGFKCPNHQKKQTTSNKKNFLIGSLIGFGNSI
jgi:hypothetical protein